MAEDAVQEQTAAPVDAQAPTSATCSTCQAPIRWVYTLVEARRMPLDPDPHPDGNIVPVVLDDGRIRAKVLTGEELPAQVTAWRTHFVTCPHSEQHRRRKAAAVKRCLTCRHPLDPALEVVEGWEARYHAGCAPAPARRPVLAPAAADDTDQGVLDL